GRPERVAARVDASACSGGRYFDASHLHCPRVPTPREILSYMRVVASGSPVDPKWSVGGMIFSQLRHGRANAPADSPLTLQDVLASEEYRDLMTAKVAVGDAAPDFQLERADGSGTVGLSSLVETRRVVLIFGSYT